MDVLQLSREKQAETLREASKRLQQKYELTGEVAALEQAISLAQQAVHIPVYGADRAKCLNGLGVCLQLSYGRTEDPDILEQAITVTEDALDVVPAGNDDHITYTNNLANCFRDRYLRTGQVGDMDRAILLTEEALKAAPDTHPDRAFLLGNLANCLGDKYTDTHENACLNSAIEYTRQAIDAIPSTSTEYPLLLSNLAVSLKDRYVASQDMMDLDEAIRVSVQAISTLQVTHADRAMVLSNLGIYLSHRYHALDEMADVEEAIKVTREAISITPAEHADNSRLLQRLGTHLAYKYWKTGDRRDLKTAISVIQESVDATPVDHAERAERLRRLAQQFANAYSKTGLIADLDAAITVTRSALDCKCTSRSETARLLTTLADRLHDKYLESRDVNDLNEAINSNRQALGMLAANELSNSPVPDHLEICLVRRFTLNDSLDDIDEAISVIQLAISKTTLTHSSVPGRLHQLGKCMARRFLRTGEISDLDRAIDNIKRAVSETPRDHPDLVERLNSLGGQLSLKFGRSGDVTTLEKAISVTQEAVNISAPGNRAVMLSTLSILFEDRYSNSGVLSDLNEAIHIARQAIEANDQQAMIETSTDLSISNVLLTNLSNSLAKRGRETGNIEDTEEAIQMTRQAISQTPRNQTDFGVRLHNLATQLRYRWEHAREFTDLDESISRTREVLNITPADHPRYVRCLNSLGTSLAHKYSILERISDLDEAIEALEKAVKSLPSGHPDRARFLHNLAICFGDKNFKTGEQGYLEKAIQSTREAIDLTPGTHPDQPSYLSSLGTSLWERYRVMGRLEDLEEAIRVANKTVEVTPDDHPRRGHYCNCLGNYLGERSLKHGKEEDFEAAAHNYSRASDNLASDIFVRIIALRSLFKLHARAKDWKKSFQAGSSAVDLIPALSPRSLQNRDNYHMLSRVPGLAADVASIAFFLDMPYRAIQLLEHGRGVLAGRLTDLRSDVSSLHQQHPDLGAQFEDVRARLSMQTSPRTLSDADRKDTKLDYGVDRRKANKQFDLLLETIRAQPRFETFLQPSSPSDMQKAAGLGPIVVINVSQYGCYALLIDVDEVRQLYLSKLQYDEVRSRARNIYPVKPELLEWLWDVAAGPIINALKSTRAWQKGSHLRVFWITTGLFSRFPIHAAGYHLRKTQETVLDSVVSSYSPSIGAVLRGRQVPLSPARSSESSPAVLIAMQRTPQASYLRFVQDEVDVLQHLFEAERMPVCRPKALKSDVLAALPACKLFHFAGHGQVDSLDPTHSKLMLEDWETDPLSVADLLEVNTSTQPPFLAYLSACGTGEVRVVKLIDESLHLMNACLLAGFRHVIGTMWKVDDSSCVEVARIAYEKILEAGMTDLSVASGLHFAIQHLRDKWVASTLDKQQSKESSNLTEVGSHPDASGLSQLSGNSDHEFARDAIPVDSDEEDLETDPLCWVPYFHFGV